MTRTAPARLNSRLGSGGGFWATAGAFLVVMAFSTVPTPLYGLYQERDGFATWVTTLVFAIYGIGVVASLLFLGHLSDGVGRRPLVLGAIGLELASAVVFVLWPEVAGLLLARFLSGVGVGAITAAATAQLSELRAAARPDEPARFASTVATVVKTGGLSLGPLVAGALAQWAPAPLTTPFALFAVLLVAVAIAAALVPETVTRSAAREPYRPQPVRLPDGPARGAVTAATVAALAGFSVFGFFSSLTPVLLAEVFDERSRIVAGFATFAMFAASTVAQIVTGRVAPRAQLVAAMPLVGLGLVLLVVAVTTATIGAFLAGAALAGAGVGLLFRTAIATSARVADPAHRGETVAVVFVASYVGLAVPALLLGVLLSVLPLVPVIVGFAAVVALSVIGAGMRMRRA